jgi:hypothetical protein
MNKSLVWCQFVGGPLDGAVELRTMTVPPGEVPRLGVAAGNASGLGKPPKRYTKHVYQALATEVNEGNCQKTPLRMEFVQVIPADEDVYG